MSSILPRPDFDYIYALDPGNPGKVIGTSRDGRSIYGHVLGTGNFAISLIGGCHADEPVGPLLLRKLAQFLGDLPPEDSLLSHFTWVIIPDANPDGAAINSVWWHQSQEQVDLAANLIGAYRELPGDDIEFGFPLDPSIGPLRPENQHIYAFWKSLGLNFKLHASLHGMHRAYGPWFLLDKDFAVEAKPLIRKIQRLVFANGCFA